jgi:hypothetical protein
LPYYSFSFRPGVHGRKKCNLTTPSAEEGDAGSEETIMLNILLSHWAIYVYAAYVLVLAVLCIVYRPRVNTFHRKLRQFRPRVRMIMPRHHVRPFR